METTLMRYVLSSCLVGLAIGGTSGCGAKIEEDMAAARSSVASFESSAEVSHVTKIYGNGLRNIQSEAEEEYLEEASASIQAALEEAFAGCVTPYPEDTNPSTVGATFSCTGTNGLFTIVGTVEATLTPVMQGIKVVGSKLVLGTENLVVSGRPVIGGGEVVYTNASGEATVDLGFDVTDDTIGVVHCILTGVVIPTETCLRFDGLIVGEGDDLKLKVTVAEFERCEGACPTAGGQALVEFTDSNGYATLTIDFDGTGFAQVTSSRGRTFTVELMCNKQS